MTHSGPELPDRRPGMSVLGQDLVAHRIDVAPGIVRSVARDVDGAAKTNTYFAINAGAKLIYNFNRSVGFVLSPQGDIAFSKKSELTTDNAWVWPVTAGLRVRF